MDLWERYAQDLRASRDAQLLAEREWHQDLRQFSWTRKDRAIARILAQPFARNVANATIRSTDI